jgi:hypothetical protein
VLLTSDNHYVGAYLCCCVTVRLLGIIRICILEYINQQCGNKVTFIISSSIYKGWGVTTEVHQTQRAGHKGGGGRKLRNTDFHDAATFVIVV